MSVEPKSLLILLGHKNDSCGPLSQSAKSRCDRAIEILISDQNLDVLPTGTYGDFNPTATAHGVYLRNYLIEMGISPTRILPHTNSTNTIEDALCARKIIIDDAYEAIIVVTSRFHMPRTQFIFGKVFSDKTVRFESAISEDITQTEESKLKKTMAEWVETPLYNKQRFPQAIYDAASSEQKHYDTISMAIVTALFVAFVYPHADADYASMWTLLAILLSGVIVLILVVIYELTAQTARTARRVMTWIEVGFGCYGFSTSHPRQTFSIRNLLKWLDNRNLAVVRLDAGIRGLVIAIRTCDGRRPVAHLRGSVAAVSTERGGELKA